MTAQDQHTRTNTLNSAPMDGQDDPSPQNGTQDWNLIEQVVRDTMIQIGVTFGMDRDQCLRAANTVIADIAADAAHLHSGCHGALSGADNELDYYGGPQ